MTQFQRLGLHSVWNDICLLPKGRVGRAGVSSSRVTMIQAVARSGYSVNYLTWPFS